MSADQGQTLGNGAITANPDVPATKTDDEIAFVQMPNLPAIQPIKHDITPVNLGTKAETTAS